MSLSPEIRDQAYQFFIEEAAELLHIIEMGLLDLRNERSTAKIHEVMRAAHSIKGGAASVELDTIKAIAHRLESIFKALYSDTVIITPELETALLQGYDCLRMPLEQQISTGAMDDAIALAQADPILQTLEGLLGDALQEAESYVPTSEELGVDIVASIFEVDVVQGLERLQEVRRNPGAYPVVGELRAQLEVFSGLAEILNLPGFGVLTQAALDAIHHNPDRVLEILDVVLGDFEIAKNAVLAGDRKEGGAPSVALQALAQGDAVGLPDVADPDSASLPVDVWGEPILPYPGEEPLTGAGGFEGVDVFFDALPPDLQQASLGLEDVFGDGVALEDVFGGGGSFGDSSPSLDSVFGDSSLVPSPGDSTSPSDVLGLPPSNFPPGFTASASDRDFAVDEVKANFDQLPSVASTPNSLQSLLPPQKSKGSSQTQIKKAPTTSGGIKPTQLRSKTTITSSGASIRVSVNRMEQMNNLVGELVISRNSISLQNDQLQAVVRELTDRFGRFQDLLNQLRTLADQTLVQPGSSNREPGFNPLVKSQASQPSQTSQPAEWMNTFDVLEMDRYNTLHAQVQDIFEEVLQLEESVSDISLFAGLSNQALNRQRQQLNQLQTELMWVRMLPLGDVLNRFPRILRDLSNQYGKSVQLKLLGTGVLVDKSILEKLYDPLLHLLRNAFDHGLEPSDERLAQGKSAEGTIELEAYHRGNQTIVEIRDDGRGINLEKVGRRAMDLGWITPEELANMKPERLLGFLFESGFSTASKVTEISGRGVGLDVVKSQLRELKGSVEVSSVPQEGSTFTLRLPLTLTIAKLLTFVVNSTLLALPSDSIEEILIPQSKQIKTMAGQTFFPWREQLIPLYPVSQLVRYGCVMPDTSSLKLIGAVPAPSHWQSPLLIVRRGLYTFALQVDRLLTEQELVIKPFGSAIAPPPYVYGCTILSDGRLVPVIDAAILVDRLAQEPSRLSVDVSESSPSIPVEFTETKEPVASSRGLVDTILVVDDSSALRRTLALTLQKAGYRVVEARDGLEALNQLETTAVNLVICDVEMPNMNGFEFLSQRRRNSAYVKIPVFMLTSRSNEKHRSLALQLGATSYFSKPYIESELLSAIRAIIQNTVLV